jgi:DNA invertase Pin-like site-specific DNA recombinase
VSDYEHAPKWWRTNGDGKSPDLCAWLGCGEKKAKKDALCVRHSSIRRGQALPEGEKRRSKNLTPEQDAEVARRLRLFESPKTIAKDYGVTTSAVHRAAARHKAAKSS